MLVTQADRTLYNTSAYSVIADVVGPTTRATKLRYFYTFINSRCRSRTLGAGGWADGRSRVQTGRHLARSAQFALEIQRSLGSVLGGARSRAVRVC